MATFKDRGTRRGDGIVPPAEERRRRDMLARCFKAAVMNGGIGTASGHGAARRAVGAGGDALMIELGASAVLGTPRS